MSSTKFTTMLHKRTNKITRVLTYIVLEWTLIFLLLLNSLFSYFILKFAVYFGLKPPCLFCSRLDHVLETQKNNKSTFSSYKDFICEQHASEISKFGYCSNHGKIFQSKNVCNDCSLQQYDAPLFKWMKDIGVVEGIEDENDINKCSCCDVVIKPTKDSSLPYFDIMANLITERELKGCFVDQEKGDCGYQILDDNEEEQEQDESEDDVVLQAEKQPLLSINDDNDFNDDSLIVSTKSLCCDMLPQHLEFYIDHDDYRLIPVENVGGLVKVESNSEESSKEKVEKIETLEEICREVDWIFEGDELKACCEVIGKNNLASIHEVEEHEDEKIGGLVKVESNSEESEEKGENIETLEEICREVDWIFEGDELKACCKVIGKNLASIQEVEEHEDEKIGGLVKVESNNSEESEDKGEKIETLEEICREVDWIFEGDELKVGYDVIGTNLASIQEEEEENDEKKVEEHSHVLQFPSEFNDEKKEIENLLVVQEEENCVVSEITPFLQGMVEDDSQEIGTENGVHLASAVCNEDMESHLRKDEIDEEMDVKLIEEVLIEVDEHPTSCDNDSPTITDNGVCELSTSSIQLPSTSENDVEMNERSLNINVSLSNNEIGEEKIPDTPNSIESPHLHKKLLFLGRRGSVTEESLDGSIISEHEGGDGATLIEKLKLELQSEKKTLRVLYAELEEERNASAIAANQTMAMINRLQEEKATMQMEALQYQRMMEEQSEYDQEALQMMNELMVKREKEKLELEKELEVYRKKLLDFEEREKVRILSRRMEGSMRSRNSSASCSYGEESDGLSIDLNHEVKDHEEESGISPHQDTPNDAFLNLNESLASFEDERVSILEQLKVLEEKLFTLAEEEDEDTENMRQFEELYDESGKYDEENGGENGKHQERWANGSMQKRLLPLFDEVELLDSPEGMLHGKGDGFDMVENKSSITNFELEKRRLAIEEEVDHVYGRLQALEADREFLKHCIGSLKKGDKGLDLLQEILQHLRDLKNVELNVLKNMDHPCASV